MCDFVCHRDRELIRQHDLQRFAARDIIRAGVAPAMAMASAARRLRRCFNATTFFAAKTVQ
jgi:hypothetical protein